MQLKSQRHLPKLNGAVVVVVVGWPRDSVLAVEPDDPKPKERGAVEEVAVEVKEPNERPVEGVVESVVPKVRGATEDVGFNRLGVEVVPNVKPGVGAAVDWVPLKKVIYFTNISKS